MSRKLYNYHQKNNFKTTMDIGEITPIYWNVLEPGERIENLNFKNLSRMVTPVLPTMDNPYVNLYAFAVPERLIMPTSFAVNPDQLGYYFETQYLLPENKYCTEWFLRKNPKNNNELNVKKYNQMVQKNPSYSMKLVNPAIYNNEKTLTSMFGLSENSIRDLIYIPAGTRVDLMYLFAYKRIYYDFFRHKQLEPGGYDDWMKTILKTPENPDLTRIVGHKDIFHSYDTMDDDFETLKDIMNLNYLNRPNIASIDNDFFNDLQFENYEFNEQLSAGSYFNFNSFKKNIFDNFMYNDKILNKIDYGTQKDILLKIWNTDNGDRTNARLIGFEKYNQVIKQVINQTKGTTTSQSLGEVGGLSMVYNEGQLIKEYTATERTYIMVVAVPNYSLTIQNISQYNEWLTPNDEYRKYNPEMEFAQSKFKPNSFVSENLYLEPTLPTLGYQRPFNWMRTKSDVVAGEIKTKWSDWTYSVDISKLLVNKGTGISLSSMKVQKPPFKNTLISPNQDAFIQEWEFNVNIQRTIKPAYVIESELIKGE